MTPSDERQALRDALDDLYAAQIVQGGGAASGRMLRQSDRTDTMTKTLDLSELQSLLSSGQWQLDIIGEVSHCDRGTAECVNFVVSKARGSLVFSHARWLCIYYATDRVIEMDANGCVLEVTVPAGHKKIHR